MLSEAQLVNSSLPTLTRHSLGSNWSASFRAASRAGKSKATMMGVWQADMSGLSGKSKSARIVAEPAPVRDPMIGKSSSRPDSMDDRSEEHTSELQSLMRIS